MLQLIEELCRQSDKLMEEARKDKEDLQQQVRFRGPSFEECTDRMHFNYTELVCYVQNSCGVFAL